MENANTVDNPSTIGILGVNDSNLPSSSSQTAKKGGDDTPTTVVACRQCRLRKVRCDSGRPRCKNCTRRSDPCEYDVIPKRRGPDKQPGTRQRLYKKKPDDVTPPPRRTNKSKHAEDPDSPEQHELQGPHRRVRRRIDSTAPRTSNRKLLPSPPTTASSEGDPLQELQHVSPGHYDEVLDASLRAVGFVSLERLLSITRDEIPAISLDTFASDIPGYQRHWTPNITPFFQENTGWGTRSSPSYGYVSDLESCIPRGPSSSFHKVTWWDSLLSLYSEEPSQSTLKIFQDLNFLLNNTIYWLSFISFPRFMDSLYDPNTRVFVQPSVVLAALALSTMMKSSETGLGGEGRKFSLWLRDAAQSSLDASISASWIEPSLAQAAFFLALFEATSHPTHSPSRLSSSVFLLDSLIQALSLTTIDAHELSVTTFVAGDIPTIVQRITSNTPSPASGNSPSTAPLKRVSPTLSECTCGKAVAMSAMGIEPSTNWNTPQRQDILNMPDYLIPSGDQFALERMSRLRDDWPAPTDVAETQKEESRRLCWASMLLVTALREYTPFDFDPSIWDLHVTKHENIALLFPGEKFSKCKPMESVWALHGRAALLWNSCQKLRLRPDWEYRRTELAGKAWMEADAIEEALKGHACPAGHGIPYAGREYLLQLKILLSNHFMSSAPIPHTLGQDKSSAKEWLAHRAGISVHVRQMAYFVTRFGATVASLAVAKRPLSIWWAMYQIKAGVQLWKSDPTFTVALEQSVDLLAIVDFMSVMWPSDLQRRYYERIRADLLQSCVQAGIRVPAAIPIPGLPDGLPNAMMTPSISLATEASAADILMAPLD